MGPMWRFHKNEVHAAGDDNDEILEGAAQAGPSPVYGESEPPVNEVRGRLD